MSPSSVSSPVVDCMKLLRQDVGELKTELKTISEHRRPAASGQVQFAEHSRRRQILSDDDTPFGSVLLRRGSGAVEMHINFGEFRPQTKRGQVLRPARARKV
ncbi:hypothetical protein ACJJTC_013782 [Scirpophaga incertulas]